MYRTELHLSFLLKAHLYFSCWKTAIAHVETKLSSLQITLKAFIFFTYKERFLSYFKVRNSKYNIKLSFNKCFISVLISLSQTIKVADYYCFHPISIYPRYQPRHRNIPREKSLSYPSHYKQHVSLLQASLLTSRNIKNECHRQNTNLNNQSSPLPLLRKTSNYRGIGVSLITCSSTNLSCLRRQSRTVRNPGK